MSARRADPPNAPQGAADSAATIELCNSFAEYAEAGAYNRALLIDAGRHAVQRYPDDVSVLVAVGRMYLAADELSAAQAILERASRIAPQDSRIVRLLAGVLLRLGDSRRAEEAIDGAIARGASEREMRTFRVSMQEFVAAQKALGKDSVPREVKRKLARAAAEVTAAASAVPPPRLLSAPPPAWEGSLEEWNALMTAPAPTRTGYEPQSNFRYVKRPERAAADDAKSEPVEVKATPEARPVDGTSASGPHHAMPATRDVEPPAPPKPGRSRQRRWAMVGGAALLLVLVPVGAGLYQRGAARDAEARELCRSAANHLQEGGPDVVTRVDAELDQALALAPESVDAVMCMSRVRALEVLQQAPAATPRLVEMLALAGQIGASPAELAYLDLTAAVGARDARRAEELVARYDQDPSRRVHAVYELSAGAALELVGDPRAVDRYKGALGLEPTLFVADVRVARALLLEGSYALGKVRAQAISISGDARPDAKVLDALVKALDPAGADALKDAILPVPEEVPIPLRGIARALGAQRMTDKAARATALSSAVAEADTPSAAVFCGTVALSLGETGAASEAVRRALETAPVYPAALVLGAKIALLEGHLEEAQKTLGALDVPAAAEVRALIAYELGDLEKLTGMSEALRDPGLPSVAVALAARERMRGTHAVDASKIQALARSSAFWSDFVAIDLALDAGDLGVARTILEAHPAVGRSPLGALRSARLLRYEGSLGAARKALGAAPAVRPALVERALLDAESSTERQKAIESLGERLEPERRWLEAYLIGRSSSVKAILALTKLKNPPADAPLSLRVCAALAIAESRDRARGVSLIRPLLAMFKKNPDVIRAAVGVGLLPASSLPAR